jgi:hypothetical protein
MVDEAGELEKVKKSVQKEWQVLHTAYPEHERASAAYLAEFHRIQSYDQVQSSAALRIPFAGRFADAAIDAKTSVRLIELILERQGRMEQRQIGMERKITQLNNLAATGFAVLIGYGIYQWFTG